MEVGVNLFEREIYNMKNDVFITLLQDLRLIKREMACDSCSNALSLNKYKKVRIGNGWKCITRSCTKFKEYFNVFKFSFF